MTSQTSRKRVSMLQFWVVACIAVLVDQATKAVVRNTLPPVGSSIMLVPGFLELKRVENTGAAFGLGEGLPWVFVAMGVILIALCVFWLLREELPDSVGIFMGMVVGGGVGNMIDRVAMGSVTDFLRVLFIDFPVFNVADICVTCGIILTVICYVLWERKAEAAEESRQSRLAEEASSAELTESSHV